MIFGIETWRFETITCRQRMMKQPKRNTFPSSSELHYLWFFHLTFSGWSLLPLFHILLPFENNPTDYRHNLHMCTGKKYTFLLTFSRSVISSSYFFAAQFVFWATRRRETARDNKAMWHRLRQPWTPLHLLSYTSYPLISCPSTSPSFSFSFISQLRATFSLNLPPLSLFS